MSEKDAGVEKSPANESQVSDGQITDEQLEEVAGGTGCILFPTNPDDPTDPNFPTGPIKPWILV